MNANYYVNLALHEPWAIAPDYAQSYLPLLAQLLKGETASFETDNAAERLKNKSYIVKSSFDEDDEYEEDYDITPEDAPAGAIAVLNLKGPIVKNSQFCGPRGTVELAAELKKIYANPNFIGAIIDLDSGGGQAYAVKPLTDVLEERNKPVVILAGNLLCSAGYYIAAYGDEIICDHPRSMIGCIGVMQHMVNTQPALEKLGVEFHNVNATQSPLKNKTFTDALAGDYTKLRSDLLDPLAEDFTADVKKQRPGITNDKTIFQGETFLANKALDLGMIDYLGNKDFAISRVKTLSKNYKAPKSQPKNSNMKTFPNVVALANLAAAPTTEQIDKANGDLTLAGITKVTLVEESFITEAAAVTTERDGLKTSLQTEKDAKTEATNDLAAEIVAHNKTKQLLADANAKLGKQPGATHKPAASTENKDVAPEVEEDDDVEAILAAMPHNQKADKITG